MAPYNPAPDEQWSPDDLAKAEAAKDYRAIDKARRAGHLSDLLAPPKPETSDAERIAAVLEAPPVGPTVPGLMPGGSVGSGPAGQMDAAELDRLSAAKDYAAINAARRAGRLINLGVPAPRGH